MKLLKSICKEIWRGGGGGDGMIGKKIEAG